MHFSETDKTNVKYYAGEKQKWIDVAIIISTDITNGKFKVPVQLCVAAKLIVARKSKNTFANKILQKYLYPHMKL